MRKLISDGLCRHGRDKSCSLGLLIPRAGKRAKEDAPRSSVEDLGFYILHDTVRAARRVSRRKKDRAVLVEDKGCARAIL